MKILTRCDKCNASFSVEETFVGRKAKCSKCGEAFIVQAVSDALEPQTPVEGYSLSKESPAAAAGKSDIDALLSAESNRCPNCALPLAPGAVLCVNCGYDLRTGAKVQHQKSTGHAKRGGTLTAPKKQSDDKSKKVKKKTRGIFTTRRLVLAGVFVAMLAGSIAGVWGILTFYRYSTTKWNQYEAFVRLDYIFSEKKVSAKKLAQELPYIFAYQQNYPVKFPNDAGMQEAAFLEVIPRIPKDADPTPLLEFPPDSREYQPILNLLKQNTDLSWQIEKSCDSSEITRHYGGDLLMASLPFISWSEADKISFRERTDVGEKQRRFRKFADQSQVAAEKTLPGRYSLRMESVCTGKTKDKGGIVPDAKDRKAETPGVVFEAATKNKTWTITFAGRTWTDPIEQFGKLDLSCPVKEYHDLFAKLPFIEQLEFAEFHLRFRDDKFVVELEGVQKMEFMADYKLRMMALFGFNGFQCTLIKAAR